MNAKNLKILPDNLIATNNEAAFVGAIVYWRLGGNILPEALRTAWNAAGLDEALLPSLPSAKTSLTRAVDDVAKDGKIKTKVKDGGYAILGKNEENGLTIEVNCRASLDAKNDLLLTELVAYGAKMQWEDCPNHPLFGRLLAAFESHKGSLEARDITSWLCGKVMKELGATTLREDGGVYFVPRDHVELLGTIVKTLGAVSAHKIYQVKAMTGDEAVEAVLDAILTEAQKAADAVEDAIAQGRGEPVEGKDVRPLGHRALASRADDCREMVAKVKKYEALLGARLPDITERLGDLKVAAMEASFAEKAAKDEAKAKAKLLTEQLGN
jgi:hypothetical protein